MAGRAPFQAKPKPPLDRKESTTAIREQFWKQIKKASAESTLNIKLKNFKKADRAYRRKDEAAEDKSPSPSNKPLPHFEKPFQRELFETIQQLRPVNAEYRVADKTTTGESMVEAWHQFANNLSVHNDMLVTVPTLSFFYMQHAIQLNADGTAKLEVEEKLKLPCTIL